MSGIDNPSWPPNREEQDPIRVSPIDKDKKGDEPPPKPLPEKEKKLLFTAYLSVLFDTLSPTLPKFQEKKKASPLLEILHTLKELFLDLSLHDKSEDPTFAEIFSQTWRTLLEASPSNDSILSKKASALSPIETLILAMKTHPKKEDHSLGFYLSKYTGEKWLPFPFIEILKQLHQDYRLRPQKSVLTEWILLIDSAMNGLDTP